MVNNFSEIITKRKKPLLLDGAIGTLLLSRNSPTEKLLWSTEFNVAKPDEVRKIHQEYFSAGAEILTTNTFRSNPLIVNRTGKYSSEELVKSGIKLARVSDKIFIAGCNPPAEDCYQKERTISIKELKQNHSQHIDLLIKYGADFILNETFSHLDEILFCCEYCNEKKYPYIMSLYFNEDLKILSGEKIIDVVNEIKNFNPILISFNCINPTTLKKLLTSMQLDYEWMFYCNCGKSKPDSQNLSETYSPQEYYEEIKFAFKYAPKIVGACCGSTPEHIKYLREKMDEENYN